MCYTVSGLQLWYLHEWSDPNNLTEGGLILEYHHKYHFFMSAGQVERTSNSFFVAANCQKRCKKSHLLNCRLSKSSCQLIWPAEHVINPCQAASKWEGDLRYDPWGTHQRARRYFGMLTLDCKKKTVSHAVKSIRSGKQVGPWKQNRSPVVLPSVDFTHLSDTNVSACFADLL